MKKLLALNIGTKGFRTEYDEASAALGLTSVLARSRYSCFVLKNGHVALYHQSTLVNPEEFGYVFIRVTGKYTLMTSLIAQYFTAHHIPISDPAYLQHTRNEEKITQMLLFTLAGVATPNTTIFTLMGFEENKDTILSSVSFPCVLKTNGSQGRNVWKIDSVEALEARVAELLAKNEEVAMVQEFVPNDHDIRALYMHGDIIGAIKRSGVDGFLNNVSQGGKAEPVALTEEEIELSKKACNVLGRSFAGVDIVRTPQGPMLFEVNLGPQIYGFESATGMNVPAELLKRIKAKYDLS